MSYAECELTPKQLTQWQALQVKIMRDQPFFAFIMMERLKVIMTRDPGMPTAATNGVDTIWFNADWLFSTKNLNEQLFVYCHEIEHAIYEHMPRSHAYALIGALRGEKFDPSVANQAQDYRNNKDLLDSSVGSLPADALVDRAMPDDMTWEDKYHDMMQNQPPPPPPGRGQKPGQGQGQQGNQPGQGQQPQGQSPQGHGGFDIHLPPPVDPNTGKPVAPDTQGMKECILQAASVAKSQGKMPSGMQRLVDQLKEPQVPWEEHLQYTLSRLIGQQERSYARLHRRKIAVAVGGMQLIWPGYTGKGVGEVWVGGDTSGSMGKAEMTAAASEVQGILVNCRPERVMLAWCDAAVHRVDEMRNIDELAEALSQGVPGGGGTDFNPVFDEIARRGAKPCALVFITDGYGDYPDEAPLTYPVIWCMTTDKKPPFGDVIRIKV